MTSANPTQFSSDRAAFGVYDQIAPVYDRLHGRFLRLAGGEAQAAMEGALAARLRPGLRVLDAGCGTGGPARRLLAMEPLIDMTLIDTSPGMLARTPDVPARRMHASMLNIPLADNSFDLTLAFWSIETLEKPELGLSELVRLTRPGGMICLVFCAVRADGDWIDRAVSKALLLRGTGRMIDGRMVDSTLKTSGAEAIRWLPCRGPAHALIAFKRDAA